MKSGTSSIVNLLLLSLAVSHCTFGKSSEQAPETGRKKQEASDKRQESNAVAQEKVQENTEEDVQVKVEEKTKEPNASASTPNVESDVKPTDKEPEKNVDKKVSTPEEEKINGKAICKVPEGTVDLAKIREWVAKDRENTADNNIKYTYVPLDLVGKPEASIVRVGVFKALNHLAVDNSDIVNGKDVTGHCILYKFNIKDFFGDRAEQKWGIISSTRGQLRVIVSPAAQGALRAFDANEPVAMDQLTFNATQGGIYSAVIDAPDFVETFNRTFRPNPEILAVSDHKEAIVCGPRQVSYQKLPDGRLYAKSGDEFFGVNGKNGQFGANQAPISPRNYRGGNGIVVINSAQGGSVAAEAWVEMKNGFIAYYIHGEGNQARTRAEYVFAIDPTNEYQNYDLTTGRSCITCHVNGTQAAPGDQAGQGNWTSAEDLNSLYNGTKSKFKIALGKIVSVMSDSDTVSRELMSGLREPVFYNIKRVEKANSNGRNPSFGYNACASFCGGKFKNSFCKNLADQLSGGPIAEPEKSSEVAAPGLTDKGANKASSREFDGG